MENDIGSILIFQTKDTDEIPGLSSAINEIRNHHEVTLENDTFSAVIGEFAGDVLDILIAHPTQAFLNAAALGTVLWKIIDLLRKAGKKIMIGKKLVIPLIASKAQDDFVGDKTLKPDSFKVWGPMEANIIDGPMAGCIENHLEALSPKAYFLAIAKSKPRNRVKTTYYLLGAGGKVGGTWTTQTFSERVPEFLKPQSLNEKI
jgi:hypothetical protein